MPNAEHPRLDASDFNVGCSTFGVCFCHSARHISPPDEPADQFLLGALRPGVRVDGAGHSDAATKERRSRCGLWRRGHREYFRRPNHQRAGEVHHLAGWHIFRAHAGLVDPVCAPEHGQ